MSKHRTHRMHTNSIESWRTFDQGTRSRDVCEVLNKYGEMTDREVCCRLGYQDLNAARPTITKLISEEVLEEKGRVECETTGRMVRLVGFVAVEVST